MIEPSSNAIFVDGGSHSDEFMIPLILETLHKYNIPNLIMVDYDEF